MLLINQWLKNNLLVLNAGKTKFMILCRSKQMATVAKNYNFQLYIEGQQIHQVDDNIYLGLHIDNLLTWNLHIDRSKSCITPYVFVLKRAKKVLSKKGCSPTPTPYAFSYAV